MNWKVFAAVAAIIGGIFWAAHRKNQRSQEDAALWAEATEPVVRFGD